MELDRLVAELSNVAYVNIGNGPLHPFNSNRSLAPELDDYLRKHPFLRDYPDYVHFLERFAGASLNTPHTVDPNAFLVIFGIGAYYEEELVDQEQLVYCFCDSGINGDAGLVAETEFLFDVSGSREKAVYSRQVGLKHRNDGPIVRAYPGFLSWLAAVIATKGVIANANFLDPPFGKWVRHICPAEGGASSLGALLARNGHHVRGIQHEMLSIRWRIRYWLRDGIL